MDEGYRRRADGAGPAGVWGPAYGQPAGLPSELAVSLIVVLPASTWTTPSARAMAPPGDGTSGRSTTDSTVRGQSVIFEKAKYREGPDRTRAMVSDNPCICKYFTFGTSVRDALTE